ncbi:MAG: hypothetical protein GX052_10050 [Syntrophomonadaceae bacterium]|nr:hypothetical protein [Syntrophomonadaceae bacterium]
MSKRCQENRPLDTPKRTVPLTPLTPQLTLRLLVDIIVVATEQESSRKTICAAVAELADAHV